MSEGKAKLRVICFHPQLREKLSSSLEEKSAVSIVNCQVRDTRGRGSEVLLTKSSKVETSPKNFTSINYTKDPAPVVTMNDVPAITHDQTITVMIKVMIVDPPEDVKKKRAALQGNKIALLETVKDAEGWCCGKKMSES